MTAPVGDAYYFFNPFGEYSARGRLSDGGRHRRYGDAMGGRHRCGGGLAAQRTGGNVDPHVNGFGGRMPAGYELVRVDWKVAGVLRLWRKRLDTARIGSPRMMKNRSRARLALASMPSRARESSGRRVSGCRAERRWEYAPLLAGYRSDVDGHRASGVVSDPCAQGVLTHCKRHGARLLTGTGSGDRCTRGPPTIGGSTNEVWFHLASTRSHRNPACPSTPWGV